LQRFPWGASLLSSRCPPGTLDVSARADLRRDLRLQRRSLSLVQRRDAAAAMARHAASLLLLRGRQHIAFYLANDGELDPAALMARMRRAGRRCYLPVLNSHRRRPMRFAPYTPGIPMQRNRFAIAEPVVTAQALRCAAQLDLIVMPLVGFDDHGNRLGMGGGFYDRTLAFLRYRRHWHRPLLIGMAYEFQCLEQVSARSWDVPLDGVVTEGGLRCFR